MSVGRVPALLPASSCLWSEACWSGGWPREPSLWGQRDAAVVSVQPSNLPAVNAFLPLVDGLVLLGLSKKPWVKILIPPCIVGFFSTIRSVSLPRLTL